jgi:hypothetical protein
MVPSIFKYDDKYGCVTPREWDHGVCIANMWTYRGTIGVWRAIRVNIGQEMGPNILQVQLKGEDYFRIATTHESCRNMEWVPRYIESCEKAGKILTWEESRK